jgi:hypothetical protein
MIPESGSGIVETNKPLLPDILFPHAERPLQYQLYDVLSEHGDVYLEVSLGDTPTAIDIVWYDKTHDRSVGIEVKRVASIDNANKQIRNYQSRTLIDVLAETDHDLNCSEETAALDEVWVASYRRPNPRNSKYDADPDLQEIVPEADGYLLYDIFSGDLNYNIPIDESASNVTKRIDYQDENLVGPESTVVASLWKQLRNEFSVLSAEASFSPSPQQRVIDQTVRYTPNRRADLVVSNKPAVRQPDQVIGIEAKAKIKNHEIVAEQLGEYIQSKMFSKVYLAIPHKKVPKPYQPGEDTTPLLNYMETSIEKVLNEVPDIGIIGIRDKGCYIVSDPECRPIVIETRREPYLIHNPRHECSWEWKQNI